MQMLTMAAVPTSKRQRQRAIEPCALFVTARHIDIPERHDTVAATEPAANRWNCPQQTTHVVGVFFAFMTKVQGRTKMDFGTFFPGRSLSDRSCRRPYNIRCLSHRDRS